MANNVIRFNELDSPIERKYSNTCYIYRLGKLRVLYMTTQTFTTDGINLDDVDKPKKTVAAFVYDSGGSLGRVTVTTDGNLRVANVAGTPIAFGGIVATLVYTAV